MITERDLQEAIAECNGKRNPDASTCVKLAAFYTILDHMNDVPNVRGYSYSSGPDDSSNVVDYYADSEFAHAIDGLSINDVWPVIDELMVTLQVTNPRLYAGVMRKLRGV